MNQQAKNKNPLLSCALTGGFEDLSTGIVLTTAEKPVFTIGNAPVISDTDNFSEVSLDRDGNSSEIGQSSDLQTDLANPYYASPLSDLDSYNNLQTLQDLHQQQPPTLDINSNNQQVPIDGNINPIAAFGTAASTVFSTFSNIIKGSTSQTRIEDQQVMQPPGIQTVPSSETFQENNNISPYPFAIQQPDPNAPAPSFFSPDEMLFNKKQTVETPSNTFRLGGNKKKTYAHIPGLSSSSQTQSQNVPQNFNLNPVMPPLPPQPITHVDSMPNFQPPPPLSQQNFYESTQQPQQQQTASLDKLTNKFSFSSLLDKIPVPMSLFGSSDQNTNETTYNNELNQQTTMPINYFTSQNQMTEPQAMNPIQSQPQNYFNSTAQAFVDTQNFSVTTTDSVISQKPDMTQNAPTVNFFNPQQFNTSPFAKVQQPSTTQQQQQQGNETIDAGKNHEMNNSSTLTSSPPPMMMMMPQNHSIQPTSPITTAVNEPQQVNADIGAPPIFFNPAQASEMFKQRQSDDGKTKNPYSNNRARGVGLYKPRTSSESSTNAQQLFMPPSAPSPQLFMPTTYSQQSFSSTDDSRPPSIPLVDHSNASFNVNQVQTNVFETQNQPLPQINFGMPPLQPPAPAQVQKKSDLNVPESEISTITSESAIPFEQEQKVHEQKQQQPEASQTAVSNVSNFFSYDNNSSSKVNEQVSALKFFQQPEINSQPVVVDDCFGVERQRHDNKLASHENSQNAVNFFAPNAFENDQQQCMDNTNNGDVKLDDNDVDDADSNGKREEIQEFNSPITSSTMQGSDLVNDITDKMESLSACSRSTLSLFATSELDSTMGQKILSSAPVESLIPKYLEQQPLMNENLKTQESLVNSNNSHSQKYRPIYCHWFYQNLYWHPFSMTDSMQIDQAILNGDEVVCTDGGRYEVNIKDRKRSSIYWTSGSSVIRKCSWFYMDEKNGNQNLIPYTENIAEFLETQFEKAMKSGVWNFKISLPYNPNDFVIMKDIGNIEHHKMEQILVVKRGVDEFDIDDGEELSADHLILCVSGFGDKIDENAADEVRTKCSETIEQYYTEAFDCGQIKRIEVLPIILNSIDVLKMYEINNDITNALPLKSPQREINEHILRTMLYSNENFYQKIMNHLAFSLNDIVSKFRQRNPSFGGEISVMSSSYEALFVFDMLGNVENDMPEFWKLNFNVSKFFACGIPTSLLMIRNSEKLRHGFELNRCKKLYNIIHPSDDISQRIEPLIIPEFTALPPESIESLATSIERIDFILPEDSALEKFDSSKYFSSEILIRRITNQIYGANHIQMDSGSL